MTMNSQNIKYWHTVTIREGEVKSYDMPTLEGVDLVEIRRVEDCKTYIYHVPADEVEQANDALDILFNELEARGES